MTHHNFKYSRAFTIVELLVVIVVIGILATITIVSYTGISNQAIVSTLKADLTNGFKQLKLFQVENSGYPVNQTVLTTCPATTGTMCFRPSPGNTIVNYIVNNAASPQTFVLTLQHGNLIYEVTESTTSYSVTPQPLTGVSISGSTAVGSVLTATSLTPSGATATYQWQSATTSGGTYTNISGATGSTYTLVSGDGGKYIKVVATGNTIYYFGSVTSAATSIVITPLASIGAITGTVDVGQVLTAGTLAPSGATATYQWQSATTSGGTYTNISGATGSTYTLVDNDYSKFIKVIATGSGNYNGTLTSAATTVVTGPWVVAGTQTWAKFNLNVGTRIDISAQQTNNAILEKYCYGGLESNCTTYGGMYQWDEMMQYVSTEGVRGICPVNSHIPTDAEWATLITYSGGLSVGGTALKVGGSTGLNILLAGYAHANTYAMSLLNSYGFYWSSTLSGSLVWEREFNSSNASINRYNSSKDSYAYSVRCLRN